MNLNKLKGRALVDAQWVLTFPAGQEWLDGDASGFRPKRLAELKEAGVFLPLRDGMLQVAPH